MNDTASARRAVIGLAWPIVIENLLMTLLQVVDTALVGRLGASAVAAVGGASQYVWFLLSSLSALTIGTTILVARATGAKDQRRVAVATRQSLLLALAVSIALGIAGNFLADTALVVLGAQPEVVALGGQYLRITLWFSVGMLGQLVCGAALRGMGNTRTPMFVGAGVNALNLLLAYPLIFGLGPVPALGVAGSAWATSVARLAGAAVLVFYLFRPSGPLRAVSGTWKPDLDLLRRLVRVGLPASGENALFSGGFVIYTALAAGLGTVVLAAQRITFNALAFSFMIGMAFQLSVGALVGQALGRGDPDGARQVTRQTVLLTTLAMGAVSLVLFLFPGPIIRAFTPQEEIIEIGTTALRIIAVSQPLGAPGLVWSGAMRGAGDTRWVMWSTAVTMWLVRLPVSYLGGYVLNLGLDGIYLGNLADLAVRTIWSWLRYRQGKWERIKV